MGINQCRGVLTYAPVSGAVTRHHVTYFEHVITYMRGKIHREKCDVQTRPYDKTKPNVCNIICNIIVQRNFRRFSPDLPENRYRIVRKTVAKSVMILIIVRPLYRRCEERSGGLPLAVGFINFSAPHSLSKIPSFRGAVGSYAKAIRLKNTWIPACAGMTKG